MCGIALTYAYPKIVIENILKQTRHRGPDFSGIEEICASTSHELYLGHNRLSIIDTSSASNQPFFSEDKKYAISFNGEIYNYREIKSKLQAKGYTFATQGDTEVLLKAYMAYGKDCLDLFRGMFAFIIVEKSKIDDSFSIFFARDRFGIKPMLYQFSNTSVTQVIIASELKSFSVPPLSSPTIDLDSVRDYLMYGSVRQPKTMYKNIHSLKPGYWGKIDSSGHFSTSSYYSLKDSSFKNYQHIRTMDFPSQVNQLRTKLNEVCKYHLVSDVPVGVFLSGGIDSTAISAIMNQQLDGKLLSFSIGQSENKNLDESNWAVEASKLIGSKHYNFNIESKNIRKLFYDALPYWDQPSHDGFNTYLVSKFASDYVKVCVSGLGGDEIFGGYGFFRRFHQADQIFSNRLEKFPLEISNFVLNNLLRISPSLISSLIPKEHRLALLRSHYSPAALNSVLNQPSNTYYPQQQIQIDPELDSYQYTSLHEMNTYLVSTLLRDSDAMSMASSIELRPMLLDHDLVEFAFALPVKAKMSGRQDKYIFREAIKEFIPESFFNRQKMGFSFPYAKWINSIFKNDFLDLLNCNPAKTIFSPTFIEKQKRMMNTNSATNFHWSLFILLSYFDTINFSVENV